MNYIIDHISKNTPNNRRPGLLMTAEYITIHSTANEKSTAKNERMWLTNPSNKVTASYHIVIDDKEAIEVLPLNEVGWHAGDGNGKGNRASIGIEMCESGNREKVIQNTVELVAKMLHERNWGIDKLKRHYDWSGKNCPRILSNNKWEGWNTFKAQVQKELDKLNSKVKVNIKGKIYLLDGFLKNGTNYVKARELLEALGYKVEWDNKEKVVIVK